MIPGADQANIVGLRSAEFIEWVAKNLEKPFKRGPGKLLLDMGLVQDFLNWAKRNSTWPLHFGIMCCAIEMAATSDPRYDAERFGIIYRSSPRQCDVLLLNGPISLKLRPAVRRLYEQMAEPKWVIAMGECTICGGPYYDSYSVVKGAYTFVPVDVFIPGCPVRPEALIDGFLKLAEKIKHERRGWVKTRKGRVVSAREGELAEFEGVYTYEIH
jgi:NADH-quinone oxidoreductase subunit B